MNIRHINRGDVDEGGCPLCKPRHTRYDEEVPPTFLIEEGFVDYEDQETFQTDVTGNMDDC